MPRLDGNTKTQGLDSLGRNEHNTLRHVFGVELGFLIRFTMSVEKKGVRDDLPMGLPTSPL